MWETSIRRNFLQASMVKVYRNSLFIHQNIREIKVKLRASEIFKEKLTPKSFELISRKKI